MKLKNIKYNTISKVAIIELNRPKFLNALCDQLIKELNEVLDAVEQNDALSVVVLKGSEKVFAAGADIGEMIDKEFTLIF